MAETHRAAKKKRFTGNIITLVVGKDKEQLLIQEDIIKSSSPFFKAAVDKKWQEGKSRIIELPEDDLDVVTAYLDWLCRGTLVVDEDGGYGDGKGCDFQFLAKNFVFGEKIQDDTFCNAAISAMTQGHEPKTRGGCSHLPGPGTISVIYQGTPTGSPARKLMVAFYKDYRCRDALEAPGFEAYPAEFLFDLALDVLPFQYGPATSFFARRHQWLKGGVN